MWFVLCSKLGHLQVLIDTTCPSSFHHPPDRSDFTRTDGANFQTHLEYQIPFDLELYEMVIDSWVEIFSGAILKALVASTPKCRPRADTRPPIPDGIQDEIRLKNRLRRTWQVTREPALSAEVNRPQMSVIRRLNEWRNDQWSMTLESLDPEEQSLWRMNKRVMRVPTPSPPWSPEGNCCLRLWESRSPRLQSGDSVSACERSFGPNSYWNGWRGAEVLNSDPCQRPRVN